MRAPVDPLRRYQAIVWVNRDVTAMSHSDGVMPHAESSNATTAAFTPDTTTRQRS